MNTKLIDIRPIPGHFGYFASTDGIIWTQKRKGGNDRGKGRLLSEPRPLSAHLNGSGYLTVNFDLNGKVLSKRVHRLILETFVSPAPQGAVACHYPDPTRTNNHVENLRWGTLSENAQDRYRDKLKDTMKKCRRCQTIKSKTEFYTDKRASDGLQTYCKPCHNILSISTRDEIKKRKSNRNHMRRKRRAAKAKREDENHHMKIVHL